jgi:hypothetical protein
MKVKGQFLELSSFKLHNGNNIFFCQRASTHWLERLSGTPQVGSTSRGSEFQAEVTGSRILG